MPSPTATGPVSIALSRLRTVISASTAFQTWTGTADATAALARIAVGEVTESEAPTKPYIWLDTVPQSFRSDKVGTHGFLTSGRVMVGIVGEVASSYRNDTAGATFDMHNQVYGVMAILKDQADVEVSGVRVTIGDIAVVYEATFAEPSEGGDNSNKYRRFDAALSVEVGDRA